MNGQLQYLILFLVAVFVAALSQVLLKTAAMRPHKSLAGGYLNPQVIGAYGLFFSRHAGGCHRIQKDSAEPGTDSRGDELLLCDGVRRRVFSGTNHSKEAGGVGSHSSGYRCVCPAGMKQEAVSRPGSG